MKLILVAFAIVIISTSAEKVNPGLIGGLKLPMVKKMKDQFFYPIMEEFKNATMTDMQEGNLRVYGINVQVTNDHHNNVNLMYNTSHNGIGISVDKTFLKVHVDWVYEKGIFKIKGTGDISGPISHVGMTMGFGTQPKGKFLIPKISISDFDMLFDKSNWHFEFHCTGCPAKIINFIMNAFKGPLCDKIRKESFKIVDTKITQKINEKFYESYPTLAEINNDLSISLATTGPVSIKSDYLHVPLDATIFLTKDGYNRSFEAPEIPSEDPANPGEIQLYASKYLYQTFVKSINKIPMKFSTQILGFNANIHIDGSKVPIIFSTHDKYLHFEGGGVISIPALFLELDIGATAHLDLFFKSGDKSNMIYIHPEINRDSIKMTTFKVSIFGFKINLTPITSLINPLIKFIANSQVIPTIEVPKSDILPLTATAALVKFFDTYTEAGIAFNFGFESIISELFRKSSI